MKCVICKEESSKSFMKSKDRLNPEKEYEWLMCNNCHLVFLKERKKNNEFVTYNKEENVSKQKEIVLWMFYNKLRKFKKQGKVLDFGSGTGTLARYLINKGYDVECFDVDKGALEWIKTVQKIPIQRRYYNKKYDIIIMEQVIEHLKDPVSELKKIKKSLNEDGVILASIPNINSLQAKLFKEKWFHLDAPRHLNHFYLDSFNRMLDSLGLKIMKKYYFNINIDSTGWYWSMKKELNNLNYNTLKESLLLAMTIPLIILTSIFKSSGSITYVIKKKD